MINIGYSCAYLAGTFINAVSNGYGCSFGINLKSYAKVTLNYSSLNRSFNYNINIKCICYNKYNNYIDTKLIK